MAYINGVRPNDIKLTCDTCGRTRGSQFFLTLKSGEKAKTCTECLTKDIDNRRPSTFKWILEKLDIPFIPNLWLSLCKKQYMKNPESFGPNSVLGTYFRTMKMHGFNQWGYADSDEASDTYDKKNGLGKYEVVSNEILEDFAEGGPQNQEDREFAEALQQSVIDQRRKEALEKETFSPVTEEEQKKREREEEERKRRDKRDSEISKTLNEILRQTKRQAKASKKEASADTAPQTPRETADSFLAAIAQDRALQQEQEILDQLTDADVRMLSLKWGPDYRPTEWLRLEEMYQKYASEYEMNVDREETLKLMCKTNLKMSNALDEGNMADYSKLASGFDSLRKSAKFTEAQNKEKQEKYLDSVGELVAAVEKEGGIIPKFDYKFEVSQDKVDLTIRDCQSYLYNLVRNEMGLGNLIESYIQKLDEANKQNATSTSLGEGLVTNRTEEEENDRAADSWLQNLQESIAADADRMFSSLEEEEVE